MRKLRSLLIQSLLIQSLLKRQLEKRQQKIPKNTPWQQCEFLVLDMETTGLNANQDAILSMGWVAIQSGVIKLNTANHLLLSNGAVDESTAGIHLITDTDIEDQGRDPKSIARYLRRLLKNRIVVVHHAPIETAFLKRLWQTFAIKELSVLVLDTLSIERHYKNKSQQLLKDGAYRLPECRERYGLPNYSAHDALTDALATAELLLAQIAHSNPDATIDDLTRLGGQTVRLKPH
ncbi:3'-5' exonuclease [Marinomonas agarivorans]|nr:3'-5' exonuclease [Marinomonas agarivorans]